MSAALECRGLHYHYPDGTPALCGVDLTIGVGEHWGVAGSNGSGKSTLLHHFAGLHPAEEHLHALGREASKESLAWIRSRVGFLFQNPDDQLFLSTVEEDVAFGPLNLGLPPQEVERRVGSALRRMGLEGKRRRPPHRLSGGEKRAAALATVLALEPSILVLDEPTNDLDPLGRRHLIEFLKAWQGTLVAASHDLELLLEIAGHVAILEGGRVAAAGEPRLLFADAERMRAWSLEVPPSLRR